MHKSITLLQASWRGYVQQRDFLALRQAAVTAQALWLARRAKEQLHELRRRHQVGIRGRMAAVLACSRVVHRGCTVLISFFILLFVQISCRVLSHPAAVTDGSLLCAAM